MWRWGHSWPHLGQCSLHRQPAMSAQLGSALSGSTPKRQAVVVCHAAGISSGNWAAGQSYVPDASAQARRGQFQLELGSRIVLCDRCISAGYSRSSELLCGCVKVQACIRLTIPRKELGCKGQTSKEPHQQFAGAHPAQPGIPSSSAPHPHGG